MKKKQPKPTPEPKAKFNQSDFPRFTLQKSIEVAQALWDNYAGKSAIPIQLAGAMDVSPTSSNWQRLPGSSVAYGLTTGSYNSQHITLTELGKRIVAPTKDGDDKKAIVESILKPRILKEFYTRYDKAKFPKDQIAINVLIELGIPKEEAENGLKILKENGRYAGILKDIKGNLYVVLNGIDATSGDTHDNDEEEQTPLTEEFIKELPSTKEMEIDIKAPLKGRPKVFVSHGKNRKIVDQIKEILTFGQFDVVVSVEKESTAIPVPDKVFSDMRLSDAAVIHIESEEELLDKEGSKHLKINENVLIEIGAAMALYGKKFVLLCEKSIKLPSNLQGLYRCNYEGTQLDYEATMKLLKAFNEFRD